MRLTHEMSAADGAVCSSLLQWLSAGAAAVARHTWGSLPLPQDYPSPAACSAAQYESAPERACCQLCQLSLVCVAVTTVCVAGIGLKNIHCLRTVYNVAHRLADSLGNSWGLVVEVLYTLDKALPAVGSGSGGKVCLILSQCLSSVIDGIEYSLSMKQGLIQSLMETAMQTDMHVRRLFALPLC